MRCSAESPPHTRGSTPCSPSEPSSPPVSPARAGIDPSRRSRCDARPSLPRTRGDRPMIAVLSTFDEKSPPHTRGSTSPCRSVSCSYNVSPAHAGIDHACVQIPRIGWGLPRTRGDRPDRDSSSSIRFQSPPHTRGSTRGPRRMAARRGVSPAHAGIDPRFPATMTPTCRLPRTRGDRPVGPLLGAVADQSPPPRDVIRTRRLGSVSPHTRGSPQSSLRHCGGELVPRILRRAVRKPR